MSGEGTDRRDIPVVGHNRCGMAFSNKGYWYAKFSELFPDGVAA